MCAPVKPAERTIDLYRRSRLLSSFFFLSGQSERDKSCDFLLASVNHNARDVSRYRLYTILPFVSVLVSKNSENYYIFEHCLRIKIKKVSLLL